MRTRTYANEKLTLSRYAALSENTRGRAREEEPCAMRTDYQRDRDRIIYCKAFVRLKNKTQVFFSPEGDHYVTRLTHTLDVSQIARSIARALALNEDLAEAIALGHDLGHTPFGHSGERILNKLSPEGFRHNEQSVRVVDVLEKDGKGLNLTFEVRDGILNHNGDNAATLEGRCVHLADRIAYINHDIDDAIRAKMFRESDLPGEYTDVLGHSVRERLNALIHDVIQNSMDRPEIIMSLPMETAMKGLRKWMFENVYCSDIPKAEEAKAKQLIVFLYDYYCRYVERLPEEYRIMMEEQGEKKERVVCDYIAGMSDSYAIDLFEELFVPKAWKI